MSYSPKEDDFSGIYKITNTLNNKVYIGQSKNVNERLKKHKQALKGNYHENNYLQNSWNKYGENHFTFEAAEECAQEVLLQRENYWMNSLGSYIRKLGYNILKPCDNLEKFPHTEDHNKRISEGRRLYSSEELLSHLHDVYYQTGEIPYYKSINVGMSDNFHQIYGRRFGTLKNAIALSGILTLSEEEKYLREIVSKDDLMTAYKTFIDENNRFPNQSERITSNGLYSASVMLKYFSGMEEFREALGFTREQERILMLKNELNTIKEIYEECGYITTTLIDELKRTRNSSTLIKLYGSSKEIYRLAGIDVKENNRIAGLKRMKNLKQYNQPMKEKLVG